VIKLQFMDAPLSNMCPPPVLVMGVSACGKTTLGQQLAARNGWRFVDADDLHPPHNIEKMSRGMPLDDDDRSPWLDIVADVLSHAPVVVACSALRRCYRDRLRRSAPTLEILYLHASRELLMHRALGRTQHYMPASLLDSQMAALEPPTPEDHALLLDAAVPVETLLDAAMSHLRGRLRHTPR
jgi:carbohydrate kinase (thermoresistant glucokinase family)